MEDLVGFEQGEVSICWIAVERMTGQSSLQYVKTSKFVQLGVTNCRAQWVTLLLDRGTHIHAGFRNTCQESVVLWRVGDPAKRVWGVTQPGAVRLAGFDRSTMKNMLLDVQVFDSRITQRARAANSVTWPVASTALFARISDTAKDLDQGCSGAVASGQSQREKRNSRAASITASCAAAYSHNAAAEAPTSLLFNSNLI